MFESQAYSIMQNVQCRHASVVISRERRRDKADEQGDRQAAPQRAGPPDIERSVEIKAWRSHMNRGSIIKLKLIAGNPGLLK
jgi:hypothetical protein